MLFGSGAVGVTLWDGDLVLVGGNVQAAGGGARGISQTGDGKDIQVVEGWDLDNRGSI